jgi:hypothetical protein
VIERESKVQELIARLEAATGPDRDLDVAIIDALFPGARKFPLEYTASIDAALTLVPEGWRWHLGNTLDGRGTAMIWLNPLTGTDEIFAAAPAIALCIAALRARETLNHPNSDSACIP